MDKLYIVYNSITNEVYSIDTIKPIAWTNGNLLAEIPYQEIDYTKQYKFINNTLY